MSEVVWNNPAALWLLWALPVVALLALLAHQRVRTAARQFAGPVMTPRLMPALGGRGPLVKTALLVAGLALVIVAAARPAFGVYYLPTSARGLDLVVALDVSRSMLADDGGDTRLGRARSAVNWLVDDLGGDRVGLVLFAGQTVQACPLTLDRGFFRSTLENAGPAAVGRGGTKIGPALDEALRMLDTSWDRDKLVLLVTDGGDQESFPKTAAERLKDKKVRVIALGLGRADEGAPLVLDGQVVRQKDGQPVSARLNDALLKELAVATDGMHVPPDAAHRLPELYAEHFADLRRGENQEVQEKHHREQFQWFLGLGLLLLLVQAGRAPYPRRRPAARAAAPLLALLCALPLFASCSEQASAVDVATDQLARGDAEAAERTLLELGDALADDPVLAYDLACAHQARGRVREARARYADALALGDRKLRARAHVNLAMLAVEQLRQRDGIDALEGEARDAVRELANAALDDLQRARHLDPDLAEIVGRQDTLARWLRVTEDAWSAHDRAAERDARTELTGAAFLGAIVDAERGLLGRLAEGELLEDVELRQRDLADELPAAKERFDAEGGALAAAFRDEVGAGIDAAGPRLLEVASLLRDGRVADADDAIVAVADTLAGLWVLWTDPGTALGAAAREQQAFAQQLAAWSAARGGDDAEALAVVERARAHLAARQQRLSTWVRNLARRVAAEHADPEWSAVFVDRARAKLPDVEELQQRVVQRIDATGPQALLAATRAAQALAALALEWQLAGLELPALAQRLEDEQHRIVRSADALVDGPPPADGVLEGLGRIAAGVARSLAWAPLRDDQQDQVARAGYLDAALERALAPPASQPGQPGQPGQPAEPEPDPQVVQQQQAEREARRARLEPQVAGVRAALQHAADAIAGGRDAATVRALHDARLAVRALALGLGEFDALLGRAAREQEALAAASEAVAADDASVPAAAALREAVREQGATTALVGALDEGLAAQVAALEADAPTDAPAQPAADPAAREEQQERLAVLRGLGGLLGPAFEAAGEAADALEGDAADVRPRFVAAAPPQRRAADLLAEAQKQLADARLSLRELAERIADGESRLLAVARDLAAGRDVQGPDGTAVGWERVRDGQGEAGGYVARLDAALRRESTPQDGQPAPDPDADAALRAAVDAVESAHAASVDALEGDDAERSRASVDAVLDAARALWIGLAEFQPLLERAVDEQAGLVARSTDFAVAVPPDDRVASAGVDQARTRAAVPALEQKLETLAQQQQQQQQPAPGQPPGPAAGGGLSPEVIELARRNLPAAGQAMQDAEGHLPEHAWNDALDRQEEAHRLLKEILDALRDQQQQDQQQQQQQQQQQDQQDQQQQDPQQDQPSPQQLSPAELQRLLQAVRERNQRRPDPITRTPVQEDW